MSRKICPVSFNLNDPFEAELLKNAGNKGPFSKYVKRLILLDQNIKDEVELPKKDKIAHSFI